VAVQRRALERALVDDVDARRYFALAGILDGAARSPTTPPSPARATPPPTDDDEDEDHGGAAERPIAAEHVIDPEGVLPAALLSLTVVPWLDDGQSVSAGTEPDPWVPGGDATRPAVRRGARLALRWFDVPVERVAARAGLPEAVLSPPEG
jgi:hypothetical protein